MTARIVRIEVEDRVGDPDTRRLLREVGSHAEARHDAELELARQWDELIRGQTGDDAVRQWLLFGSDVYLVPDDDPPFSALAWWRARSRAPPRS